MTAAGGPGAQEPRAGDVAAALAAELPGLRLHWTTVPARRGGPSPALRARLRALSDRGRGLDVIALRTRPVPHAYRAFFRLTGLDPDVDRIPAERLAVRRLVHGALHAADQLDGALCVAVAETGVGVWALDAAAVAGDGPGVRLARADEPYASELVVADERTVHAPLFGEPVPGSAPGPVTGALVLFAIGVAGVPDIHLHEALWLAGEALEL